MPPQIKKILYATDLSKNSIYAFYFAVDMAKKYQAKICVLHVVEPASATFGGRTVELHQDQPRAAAAAIERSLRDFCCKEEREEEGAAYDDLVENVSVKMGEASHEILKAVDREACDLIVLGNHGKGFMERIVLGNVARSVISKAKKPVFLIPLPSEKELRSHEGMIQKLQHFWLERDETSVP